MRTDAFTYEFRFAALTDIGRTRSDNQDEVVLAPELGFFGVSDGMGGLPLGREASECVRRAFPVLLGRNFQELPDGTRTPEEVAEAVREGVQLLSDRLYAQGNSDGRFRFGATIVGAELFADRAIFVCLGDSRGYILRKYKRKPEQVTEDMNVAGLMVRAGQMTKEEALESRESSRLTAFVGMTAPAVPEVFIEKVQPGDKILLCSDGLYGMVPEKEMARILRSGKNPELICRKLIDLANENGGRDNISAVVLQILE